MRTTKVYIAAASSEWRRAADAADRLCVLTSGRVVAAARWFDDAEAWTGRDHGLALETARALAGVARFAIIDADAFLLLAPESPTLGALWEFGYAVATADAKRAAASEYPVHVSGRSHRASIFYSLAVTSDSVHESIDRIVQWDNARRASRAA